MTEQQPPREPDAGASGEKSASTPRAFVSYAWTNAAHQQWVLDLATRLVDEGIDVVVDVWNLRPGQDKYHFMERMVRDSSVKHVLMICNATYAAKADDREGGVGDETQIITPEIYSDTANEKFIPILSELDPDGKPYLPAYLKARIWIDLSSEQLYYSNYERLLRILHGAPAFPKPRLGAKPRFLSEGATTGSTTSPLLRRAVHAWSEEKRNASALSAEYLESLGAAIASLRFHHDASRPIDEAVIGAIQQGKSYRDEFLELLDVLCKGATADTAERMLVTFLEKLLTSCHQQEAGSWQDAEFDGVRFVTMELFLYTVTFLLNREQTAILRTLVDETFVYREDGGRMTKERYGAFWSPIESLEHHRKQRLKLNRVSIVADLIKERADQVTIPFGELQQADFLLFLRSKFLDMDLTWWPRTLVHLSHHPGPFELFLAPESRRRFARLQAMLDVRDVDHLRSRFEASFPDPQSRHLNFGGFMPLPLMPLVNLQESNQE